MTFSYVLYLIPNEFHFIIKSYVFFSLKKPIKIEEIYLELAAGYP